MDQQSGQTLTFEGIAEQYKPENYILLMPQISRNLLHTVPMWSLDVATVKIDPNDKKQAYQIVGSDYGLSKTSIDRLSTAADLSIMARRIDDRSNRMRAEFEAVAMMDTPSGGARGQARSCEWDGELAKEKVHAQAVASVQKNATGNITEEQFNLRVQTKFQKDWLAEQEFGKRKTESKAGNRAVRALLGLNTSYSKTELMGKEFAVVRFVFTPDCSDREVKMLVISQTLQSRSMLYPAAPALPPAAAPAGLLESGPSADTSPVDVTPQEPTGPSEETDRMIGDIHDMLADWDGSHKEWNQLNRRLDVAIKNKDAETVGKIWNHLTDCKLKSEEGK